MSIDYTKVIRHTVEPKLAYHGFRYNDEQSHPPTGQYSFTRSYWGKSQYVNIGRVEYSLDDVAELTAEGDDIPTEVPQELLLIQEPDYRLWVSNRYISAVVGHEAGGVDITPTGLGELSAFKPLAGLPFDEAQPILKRLKRQHLWWEFRSEAELRAVLGRIVEIILAAGLDWFNEQVADTRRYHEKLEARRKAEKERRVNDSPKKV